MRKRAKQFVVAVVLAATLGGVPLATSAAAQDCEDCYRYEERIRFTP